MRLDVEREEYRNPEPRNWFWNILSIVLGVVSLALLGLAIIL